MDEVDEKVSLPLFRWNPEDEADLRRPSPKKKPPPKVPTINNLPHRLVNHEYMRTLKLTDENGKLKKVETPDSKSIQQKFSGKAKRMSTYCKEETISPEFTMAGKRKTRVVSTLTSSGDYCLSLK
jgi:hypothetical protein